MQIFTLAFVMIPLLAIATNERATIGGLVFDCFDQYGTGTCRFTADFEGSNTRFVVDITPFPKKPCGL